MSSENFWKAAVGAARRLMTGSFPRPLYLLILTLYAVAFFVFYRNLPECAVDGATAKACLEPGLVGLSEAAYRALMLFALEGNNLDPHIESTVDQTLFHLVRLLAPVVLIGAIIQRLSGFLSDVAFRIKRVFSANVVVVIGLGRIGRMFARHFRQSRYLVVGVEANPTADLEAFCRHHSIRLIVGDGIDPEVLDRALSGRIKSVAVVTDDDVRNMAIAGRIRKLWNVRKSRRNLRLDVHIFDPRLALRLHDYRFLSMGDKETSLSMLPFSFYTVTARELLRTTQLHTIADLRGQRRIHAAVFGFGSMGESLFVQIAQLGHYKDFERPRITIFDQSPDACRRIIDARYPQIGHACVWEAHPIELGRMALEDCRALREAEDADGITASFLCLGVEADNIAAALELRGLMTRFRRFLAPVFVRINDAEGLDDLMLTPAPHRGQRFQDVLRPFGLAKDILGPCGIDGDAEWLARIIHFGYWQRQAVSAEARCRDEDGDGVPDFFRSCVDDLIGQRDELVATWPKVPETFRDSSRAGADHLGVKLAGLGYDLPDRPASSLRLPGLPSESALRWLDRLEHTRWMADRFVVGYSSSDTIKDDDRRLHRLLVPFEALRGEDVKDRDMNMLLLDGVLRRPAVRGKEEATFPLRRNYTVGVIGHASAARPLPSSAVCWSDGPAASVRARLLACAADHRLVILAAMESPGEAEVARRILDWLLPGQPPKDPPPPHAERSAVLRCPRFLPVPRIKGADDPLATLGDDRPAWWHTPEWVIDLVPPGRFGDDYIENHYAPSARREPRPRRDAVAVQRARALAYWIERCDALIHVSADPAPAPSAEGNPSAAGAADFLGLAERLFDTRSDDAGQRTRDWHSLRRFWDHPERIPPSFSSVPPGRFARHPEVSALVRQERRDLGLLEWISIDCDPA